MKPSPAAIRAAVPLSALRPPSPDTCSICGAHVDPCDLPALIYREHDERDRPTPTLVFLGHAKECAKALDDHPRLYSRDDGTPGAFPRLCVGCAHRDGASCRHPDLKANGGTGLLVTFSDPLRGAILCGKGGRIRPLKTAMTCAGRSEPAT